MARTQINHVTHVNCGTQVRRKSYFPIPIPCIVWKFADQKENSQPREKRIRIELIRSTETCLNDLFFAGGHVLARYQLATMYAQVT